MNEREIRTILVSGANGFVGMHLRALLAASWRVRGAVRREEAVALLPSGVEPVVFRDPAARAGWCRATKGVDAVVHLIAKTHSPPRQEASSSSAFQNADVTIASSLLEACVENGVGRFVYLSSIKAVGEGGPTAYDESTPCTSQDAYGTTKREAELVVAKTSQETGIDAVVLRAPLIYGPGVKGNFLQILKLVDRRFPFPIARIHNERSMIYVGNLTSAIVTLLERDRFPEPVLGVADAGTPLSTQDLVRQLGRLMGRKVVVFPAPELLLRLGGKLPGRQDLVSRLTGSLTVSAERIQRVLGWHAPFSVSEGLSRTVDWYLAGSRGGKR